jgi:molecular chaperone HtpG
MAHAKRASNPRASKVTRGAKTPNAGVSVSSGDIRPFDPNDIGGELISLLSEGLYNNPLDAIREYVQNGIDAKATRISIKFTGRTVFIRDNGNGMSMQELVNARRFAVSDKSLMANVGFRGIGIYSSFHLCDRLKITTKRQGFGLTSVADFDFKAMRSILESERNTEGSKKTPLATLLNDLVRFSEQDIAYEDSFTTVELQNIPPLYYGDLASPEEVRDYLLNTVPIDFEPTFKWRTVINDRLRDELGYRPIGVVLQYSGQSDINVYKTMPPDLERPKFELAKEGDEPQAFIWGCRNSKRGLFLPPYTALGGFLYKMKGFTVGSRSKLRNAFKQQQLYPWWTGEVYVLNSRVVPNAARDDFEYNNASYAMERSVDSTLREVYESDAAKFQGVERAREVVEKALGRFEALSAAARGGLLSLDEYSDLVKLEDEIAKQARILSRFEKSDETAAQFRSQVAELRKKTGELKKEVDARYKEGRRTTEGGGEKVRSAAPKGPPRRIRKTAAPGPSLSSLFERVDATDTVALKAALGALVETTEDVLALQPELYQLLVESMQLRLGEEDIG